MAHDANASGQESDEARLRELAVRLADGIDAALPGWVEGAVARIATAWSGGVAAALAAAATDAGADARSDVGAAVRHLLLTDIDEQWTNPLSIVRGAVVYPTRVLHDAGVPGVVRDAEAIRQFPDDDYDLTPATFADIDPSLHDDGLAWGAAKAFVFRTRRRAEGRT